MSRRVPSGYKVSCVTFRRDEWTRARAKRWLRRNGLRDGLDMVGPFYRARQRDASKFAGGFRQFFFSKKRGVVAILGRLTVKP